MGFEPLKIHNIAPIPASIPGPSVAEPERLAALSGFKIFLIYLCISQRCHAETAVFPFGGHTAVPLSRVLTQGSTFT